MTRILLADSNPIVRSSLVLLLRRKLEVNDIRECEDAFKLEKWLDAYTPDMLLLDWDLPGIDVAGCMARVRAMIPRPVVIVMSLRAENEPWALAGGADDFLLKRASGEYVLEILKKHLSEKVL